MGGTVKYLVCTDGSETSRQALEVTRELFKTNRDILYILSVASTRESFWDGAETRQLQQQEARAKSTGIVAAFVERATELGFDNIESLALVGSPPEVILQEAERLDIDIISMGARGLSAVGRLLIGSVSDYVMKQATCSVLITKSPEEEK